MAGGILTDGPAAGQTHAMGENWDSLSAQTQPRVVRDSGQRFTVCSQFSYGTGVM